MNVMMATLAMEHTVEVFTSTYTSIALYLSPIDIDECSMGNNSCHVNSTCFNTDGSYECECLDGFMGNGFNCSSKFMD